MLHFLCHSDWLKASRHHHTKSSIFLHLAWEGLWEEGASGWNGNKSSAPPRGSKLSTYTRQEVLCLPEGHKWTVVTTGRSLAEGHATQGTSLSDLAPNAVLHWSDLQSSLAVLHYQHPLQSPMINDGLFPHFCFWGHHRRTSHSTGLPGQIPPAPALPPLPRGRFSPVHDWSQEWQGSRWSWGEEGWAVGLKWMEKLKEWEFLFLQCVPLLTIISKLPEWKRIRKHQWD